MVPLSGGVWHLLTAGPSAFWAGSATRQAQFNSGTVGLVLVVSNRS